MAAMWMQFSLVLLLSRGMCSALRCHVCDSAEEYCDLVTSGVDSTAFTGNVSYTDAECDKYCIKTEVTRGAEYRAEPDFVQSVERSCGSECLDYCYPSVKMGPSTAEVCMHCCRTALCNGACALTSAPASSPAAALLAWLLFLLLNTSRFD